MSPKELIYPGGDGIVPLFPPELPHQEAIGNILRNLDTQTFHHSLRVERNVHFLAFAAGFSPSLIEKARVAALIHDGGKGTKELRPLAQARGLRRDQIDMLKQGHTTAGALLARGVGLGEYAAIIENHHEDGDGSGYYGKTREQLFQEIGEDATLIIDMIRIADSWDSAINSHTEQSSKDPEKILLEIEAQMETGKYNNLFRGPLRSLQQQTFRSENTWELSQAA